MEEYEGIIQKIQNKKLRKVDIEHEIDLRKILELREELQCLEAAFRESFGRVDERKLHSQLTDYTEDILCNALILLGNMEQEGRK